MNKKIYIDGVLVARALKVKVPTGTDLNKLVEEAAKKLKEQKKE